MYLLEVRQMKNSDFEYNIEDIAASAEAPDRDNEIKRYKVTALVKLGAIMVSAALLVIFGTIAWFTMSKETQASGMGVKVQAQPFTIQTRSGSGYYSDIYESLGTEGLEWKISSEYNFDNHDSAKIEGETEPGIEPGDHGILEFRVVPNNADSITVDCIFDIKAYVESTTLDGNGDPVKVVTEVDNSSLIGYLRAHIMLFSGYDTGTGKYTDLIGTDESLRRVLANQTYTRNGNTYTKVYWVWPLYLSDLTSEDQTNIIFAPSERQKIIAYIAANRNGFFKDCTDSEQQIISDLTALSTTYSSTTYNHYNMKYDNADLDIGNNVTYVMLTMTVE